MLCEHHRPGRRCVGQRTQEDVQAGSSNSCQLWCPQKLDDWMKDRQPDLSGGPRVRGGRSSSGYRHKSCRKRQFGCWKWQARWFRDRGHQFGVVLEFRETGQKRFAWSQGWGGVRTQVHKRRGSQQTTSCHSSGIGTLFPGVLGPGFCRSDSS